MILCDFARWQLLVTERCHNENPKWMHTSGQELRRHGTRVTQAGLGAAPAFRVPEYELRSLYELPLFLLFGILCGAVSAVFTYGTKVRAVSGQGGPCPGSLTRGKRRTSRAV